MSRGLQWENIPPKLYRSIDRRLKATKREATHIGDRPMTGGGTQAIKARRHMPNKNILTGWAVGHLSKYLFVCTGLYNNQKTPLLPF